MTLVDLHTHGLGGIDTDSDDPETMLALAGLHGLSGASAVVLSLYPAPIDVMRRRIAAVKAAMGREREGHARILGVHLEGPFLNPARCGALDPASFLPPDEGAYRRLVEGCEAVVRTVTIAPELPGATRLIRLMAESGAIVNMGHSDATAAEAEAGFSAGARGITHLFNAMRPFHHREPGLAGFGLACRDVTVEIIGDLVHLHPKTLELVFRAKDARRVVLVSDSVRGTPVDPAGQGEATTPLSGGTVTLSAAVCRLAASGLDPGLVRRAATENPASYIGL